MLVSSATTTNLLLPRCAFCDRCLVNAVNAREFCKRLEAELEVGRNTQECRGMVKTVLRGDLQGSIKDAVLYLPGGKRQVRSVTLQCGGCIPPSILIPVNLFSTHWQNQQP